MKLAPLVLPLPGLSAIANDVRFLVIDAQNNTACTETFTTIGHFESDGNGGFIAAAKGHGDSNLCGYINQRGEWLIAPTLEDARSFSADGLARVKINGLWGYIDRECTFVIPPTFSDARAFNHGLAAVEVSDNKWSYIDVTGAIAIAGPFGIAEAFSAGGLAGASKKIRQPFGYINRQGEWQIAPRFNTCKPFSDAGVAPACEDKLYGLINARGNWVLQPTYGNIREFNDDGLAFYDEVDSWDNGHGYIDATGAVALKSGRHLSDAMVRGITRAEHTGSRFFTKTGANLSEEVFSWGEHFSQFGVAIVRTRDVSIWGAETTPRKFPPNRWGLLNAEGECNLLSDALKEPLTNTDGWIIGFRYDTPLAPFITHDGALAYVNAAGALQYRLVFEQTNKTMLLLDEQAKPIWTSASNTLQALPRPFFNPTPVHFAEDPACLNGGIVDVAKTMMQTVEAKLQQFISGADLAEPASDEDEDDDDDDDTDADIKFLTVRSRIVRAYLDENQYSNYDFMYSLHGDVVAAMQAEMHEKLCTAFGPSDPDPETPAIDRYAEADLKGWFSSLKMPVNRASSAIAEENQQWFALYSHNDSGDGDAWHELWVVAAPSTDTVIAARALRAKIVGSEDGDVDVDVDEPESAEKPKPTTYEEWVAAVVEEKYNLEGVPAEFLNDALVDAAIAADVEALELAPGQFHTATRLLALVRKDAYTAAHIPDKCMTIDALTLARQLYEDDSDWAYADSRNKLTTDKTWDHNSFYNVWGADLDEAKCIKAMKSDVPLRNVPLWLRTDKVEAAAIEKDICNISALPPEKITQAMAERAMAETYSNLIQVIPEALQTEALCLKSAKAHGPSLEFIPERFRTVAVCKAALKQDSAAFVHVPEAIALEVVDALIAHALAKQQKEDDAESIDGGTYWHYPRAWIKLHHLKDAEGALADASLSLRHVRYLAYAHYIKADALRQLNRHDEAALEAAIVLSLHDDFEDPFSKEIDTKWLKKSTEISFENTSDADLLTEIKARPLALASMPRSRITANIIDAAVAADKEAVQFVPKRLMTPALYAIAVETRNKRFSGIPTPMLSEAACLEEVRNSGYSLRNIPLEFRTVAVCTRALADSSSAREYIPDTIKDEVQNAINQLPKEETSQGEHSWIERKVFEGLLAPEPQGSTKKSLQKFGFIALVLGGAAKGLFKPSTEPATLRGPFGLLAWFEQRPAVTMLSNSLLGVVALALHIWITVIAWKSEGALIGIATGVLMGLSELVWLVRFWFYEPTQIWAGLAALFIILYVFFYRWMVTKVAVAITDSAAKKAAENE